MAIKASKSDDKARKKCLAALYRQLQRLEKTQGGINHVSKGKSQTFHGYHGR